MNTNAGSLTEALGGKQRVRMEDLEGGLLHDVVYNRQFRIVSADPMTVTVESIKDEEMIELPVYGADGIRSGRFTVQPA